jgi:hypothetical protein
LALPSGGITFDAMRDRMRIARLTGVTAGILDADTVEDTAHSWLIHAVCAGWIVLMLALAKLATLEYTAWMQEDRFIEWWTVGLFVVAGLARIRNALGERRIFDLLVAAFCIFVAGEEFSWGQRLLGFTPPDYFLEHNTAQEVSLHNVANVFGQAKGILMLALLGYGVVLPLYGRRRGGSNVLRRVGATPPRMDTLPWFAAAILLLLINPVEYTGEWVETLAGGLFLITARPSARVLAVGGIASVAAAAFLTAVSARGMAQSPAALECAGRQGRALLDDVTQGTAATPKLQRLAGSLHQRVRHAIDEGYLQGNELRAFAAVGCGQTPTHAIDPWGMPYWISAGPPENNERQITIYSLGPNRRRDLGTTAATSDDIEVRRMVLIPNP